VEDQLKFRAVRVDDCDLVFSWINDSNTRLNSFQGSPIHYDSHVEWFLNRVARVNEPYLIFYTQEKHENAVGQVRFDRKPEGLVVGITVAPEHRRKGLASIMLRLAVNYLRNNLNLTEPFRAWIKVENLPSSKAFTAAGFRLVGESEIKGIPSYLYIF